jgi:hypothetical protein
MRRISKKRQALKDQHDEAREAYCRLHDCKCLWCGATPVSVHEIARGQARARAYAEPSTWMPLCWPCNSGPFNDKGKWPEAAQLALKYLRDAQHYDLVRYNAVVGYGPERITQEDVDQWIGKLTSEAQASTKNLPRP